MTSTLTPPQLDAPAPVRPAARPTASVRRRWRRRVFRQALTCAAVLALGNLLILAASALAKTSARAASVDVPDDVASIHNFEAIDATLWRGGAPSADGYRALAAAGVTTVVDLRAEEDVVVPEPLLADLGLTRVAIPIRDGQ